MGLVLLATCTAVLAPIQLVALRFDWRLRRQLPTLWHKIARSVIGVKVHVTGELENSRPLMLAVNHASWLDIIILGSIADVVFIAKSEVVSWPIFSQLARMQKTIFVEREARRKTGDQVNEIAERMAGGEIVILFPEGTTSDGNRLLPLKSSLFGAAASALGNDPDACVYIQPVALAYTGIHGMPMGRFHRPIAAWPGDTELVPHLGKIMNTGALDVHVHFCPPIAYRKDSNRKQVSQKVEDKIRDALSSLLHPDRE